MPSVREWANQGLARASGDPLREANLVFLKDASDNRSGWLSAIRDARWARLGSTNVDIAILCQRIVSYRRRQTRR